MLRKIARFFLGLLLVLMILPYFIPISTPNDLPEYPYPNSRFFLTSDNVKIHYRVDVPKTIKGKVLLVHGLAASTFSYRNNTAALVDAGYLVVAIDLPAFGYSDRQRGLKHTQVNRAKWLWELLDVVDESLSQNGPWTLVGHSMGASTILAMSNQDDQRVKTMVMIDGAVTQDGMRIPFLLDSPIGRWLEVYLRYFALQPDSIQTLLSSAYAREANQEEAQGYLEPMQVNKSIPALLDFVKTAENIQIQQWKYPNTPLLVVWGEDDSWVPPSSLDVIRPIATNLSVHIFENQGHCPHETDPGFNDVLLGFLSLHYDN